MFGREGQSFMRFNSHNTTAADAEGKAALEALSAALETVCRDVVLSRGDLVLVDNHIAAHGRSSFTPATTARTAGCAGATRCAPPRAGPST